MSAKWEDKDPEVAAVNAALDVLSKHFQSIQIFCSRIDPNPENADDIGGTQYLIMGRGNFYTRLGQCKDWIIGQDERTRLGAGDKYREDNEYAGWFPVQMCMVCGRLYWGGLPRFWFTRYKLPESDRGPEWKSFGCTWQASWCDYCSITCCDIDLELIKSMK